jgi:hypothetical protein
MFTILFVLFLIVIRFLCETSPPISSLKHEPVNMEEDVLKDLFAEFDEPPLNLDVNYFPQLK